MRARTHTPGRDVCPVACTSHLKQTEQLGLPHLSGLCSVDVRVWVHLSSEPILPRPPPVSAHRSHCRSAQCTALCVVVSVRARDVKLMQVAHSTDFVCGRAVGGWAGERESARARACVFVYVNVYTKPSSS